MTATAVATCARDRWATRIRAGLEGHRGSGLIVLSLIVLSTMAGGCSWLFTQPLPERYSTYDIPPCSTNPLPPVLDTLFAVTNTASAIYVAGQDNVSNKGTAVSLGLSVAMLWTFSAVYGYRHISECEDAHAGRWTGSAAARRARPARPEIYPPPSPLPPEMGAGAPVAPTQLPVPAAPAAPQQQDDDDPSLPRPRKPPRPIEWGATQRQLGQ